MVYFFLYLDDFQIVIKFAKLLSRYTSIWLTLAYISSILCCWDLGDVLLVLPFSIIGWKCFKPTSGILILGGTPDDIAEAGA